MSESQNTSKPVTALVRRYSCMYTPDVHKKAKKWNDGFIRLHHFNAKAYLLPTPTSPALAEVFVRLPAYLARKNEEVGLPKEFGWREGEEVEFDDVGGQQMYLCTVGEVEWQEEKDLSAALDPKTRREAAQKRNLESMEALDASINKGKGKQKATSSNSPSAFGPKLGVSPAAKRPRVESGSTSLATPTRPVPRRPVPSTSTSKSAAKPVSGAFSSHATPRSAFRPLTSSTSTPASASVSHLSPMSRAATGGMIGQGSESGKKKRLGTTGPSGRKAREGLLLDWAKFARSE